VKISQRELAKILEMSISGLKLMFQEGCPGKLARNDYDLAVIIPWVRRNKSLREATENLTAARIALITEQVKQKTMQNLIASGQYIERAKMLQGNQERIYAVKTGLLHLHRALVPALINQDPVDAGLIIKKACRELLNLFSGKGGDYYEKDFRDFHKGIKAESKKFLVARGAGGLGSEKEGNEKT
jgi:hypothetical protein